MQQHNQGMPRYDGPRELAQSLTALAHMDATQATWNREGLREDSEYRDLSACWPGSKRSTAEPSRSTARW